LGGSAAADPAEAAAMLAASIAQRAPAEINRRK
jgi:hypothetical protein